MVCLQQELDNPTDVEERGSAKVFKPNCVHKWVALHRLTVAIADRMQASQHFHPVVIALCAAEANDFLRPHIAGRRDSEQPQPSQLYPPSCDIKNRRWECE